MCRSRLLLPVVDMLLVIADVAADMLFVIAIAADVSLVLVAVVDMLIVITDVAADMLFVLAIAVDVSLVLVAVVDMIESDFALFHDRPNA